MTRKPPPSLWLACGQCRDPGRDDVNLARITPAGWRESSRLSAANTLPGDRYILRERPSVKYEIRVGPGGAGFVHLLTCPHCGFIHRRGNEVIGGWWGAFTAARRDRHVIYLRLSR